jgi:thiamine monophosphate synthase
MLQLNKRPCAEDKLLGVSTHNLTEALKAQSIGADFVVIVKFGDKCSIEYGFASQLDEVDA